MISNCVDNLKIHNLSNLLDKLSDDELIKVLSYLWFKDLYKAGIAFKRIWNLIKCQSHLLYSLYKLFWYKTIARKSEINRNNILKFNHQIIIKSESLNSFNNEITYLCSQFSRWPIDIDTSLLIKGLEDITTLVPDHVSTCVSYTGKVLGHNRSFVADSHFPVPATMNELQDSNPIWFNEIEDDIKQLVHSSFPFTKLVYDPDLKTTTSILSGIAYYEIKIHSDNNYSTQHNTTNPTTLNRSNNIPPCIAVGIAHPLHIDKLSSMPGWNDFSFAFHGDDGLFFHRHGDTGIQFTSDPEDAKFGSGDTVGFGIIHAPLTRKKFTKLFLTINGRYVGKVNETDKYFHFFPWFPIVGTDSHSAIELNFGNKGIPFLFDLISFENEITRCTSDKQYPQQQPGGNIFNKHSSKSIVKQSKLFHDPNYTNKSISQYNELAVCTNDISTNIPSMFKAKYLLDYTQFLYSKLRTAWHITDDDNDDDDEYDDYDNEDEQDDDFTNEDFEEDEFDELEYDNEQYQFEVVDNGQYHDENFYDIYQNGELDEDSDDGVKKYIYRGKLSIEDVVEDVNHSNHTDGIDVNDYDDNDNNHEVDDDNAINDEVYNNNDNDNYEVSPSDYD